MNSEFNRRDFLITTGKSLLALTASATLLRCTTEENNESKITVTVDLNDNANEIIASPGGTGKITNPKNSRYPIIVHHGEDGMFYAFSSRCTHDGCTVPLPGVTNTIICDCHQAKFSLKGELLGGPAKTNLEQFPITHTDSILTITV